jgi:serpin B
MKPPGRVVSTAVLLVSIALLVGCSEDETTAPPVVGEQLDTPATLAKRITRTNDFAVELLHRLADSDDNLIVSPHSVVTCFGMAYAGARGRTERQFADVLGFNYPQQGFHSVLKQLNELLAGRPGTYLSIDNACWGADSLYILPAYIDTLSAAYGVDVEFLDFGNQPEESRQAINQWVKNHTWGYIDDLFPPDSFDDNTYLVLANAMTFMAEWLRQFDPQFTSPGSFTRLDGSTVTADIMPGEELVGFYDGDGYMAMGKLFKGEKFSMVFILPDEGLYKSFEATFTVAVFDSIVGHLDNRYITFEIPKFRFYSNFDLVGTLHDMGLIDAFSPGVADFSGMDGTDDGTPWVDQVVHKAYIQIDEWGTIAFAGTGMEFTVGVHDNFDARRPFIYVIYDIETGTILFMGRVLDPTRG